MTATALNRATPKARKSASFPAYITDELHRYDEHLRDVRGLAATTRKDRCLVAGRLLQQKFKGRCIDISRLRPDDVRQFLASQLDAHRTASNASRLTAALRSYLRYRTTCGDQTGKLTAVILNPVHWKLASLPRALKPDEIECLLNSFTAKWRWAKRGYAIVRCALDLGLRSCEIANLKIRDIDWCAGTVTLRGTKSLRQDILPLPMETGQALVDYLQTERPRTTSPSVFVLHLGDHDRPMSAGAVRGVIRWAYQRIGLKHSRSHALRHAFACRLVENGSSLKEVADLLRHRSLNTTLIYAKLDTPKLSAVALPWPGSKS
ncbi:tyrosine-type recombinase/integrase [Thiobacillus sp.]|jgi:site-specific recombinase XerD